MASKRLPSASFIENPFIKKQNLEWSLDVPGPKTEDGGEGEESKPDDGLEVRDAAADDRPGRDVVVILDPPSREPEHHPETESRIKRETTANLSAALESGVATQPDPAAHFFAHLARHTLSPYPANTPHLSADGDLRSLFLAHVGSGRGAHFVVHQHDHPIAGVHYDLRLQVNATSSVSWAVMYGLPGDANSTRLNRNATETRVHCLWNHVVEVGSRGTGSLVIWDCGWYEVLGRGERRKGRGGPEVDPDSGGDDGEDEEGDDGDGGMTGQDKLARAFAERKIRPMKKKNEVVETSSDGESGEDRDEDVVPDPLDGGDRHGGDGYGGEGEENKLSAVEREIREVEDEFVRRTNAYRGAENSVGSVYQRRWYLSLDREACGFERRKRTRWQQKERPGR
ncbi:DNA polymerase ligase-domain-containing protein [Colletotrichum lupini]|nr:DNA polymerase ligase-domain-containing protein [Colletotrichum lupini]